MDSRLCVRVCVESDVSEKLSVISSLFLLGSVISADLSNFRFLFIIECDKLAPLLAAFSLVFYKII